MVLVVDDDRDAAEAVAAVLGHRGYRPVTALSGGDALRILRAGLEPGLIILDMTMPGIDGWDFRSAQLADARLARIPVVLYSGASGAEAIAATLRADGVSVKPHFESLLAEVARCLGRPRTDAGRA